MKKYFIIITVLLTIVACNNKKNEFLITNNSVGVLQKDTPIQKLDSIFAKDSIVNSTMEGELRYASAERITILDKEGKELLEITPTTNDKGDKIVESVLILCDKYATEKGISLQSTFKDVKSKYPDLEIEPSISSIMVTPKGKNYYFTFDKSALKTAFDLTDNISEGDIEESAKIARITVNF